MQKYCTACGQPTEYSGGVAPKFCGACGKPLGAAAFFSTPVTSIPVVTKPVHPVARRGQPVDDDGPPEFEGQDAQTLATSFAQGITVNTERKKITVGEAIQDPTMGTRSRKQAVSVEGVEVKKDDQVYACLDPKQFPQRPASSPPKTRKPRGKKNG